MNPQEQALLEQLKDVALPTHPGWWPLAPGWWLVLLGVFVLAGIVLWLLSEYFADKRRNVWRQTALDENQRLHQLMANSNDQRHVLGELSVLMRRVALAVEPRNRIASLTDEQWLQKLDALGNTGEYSDGVGSVLYRHQYHRDLQLDDAVLNKLFSLTASTIKNARSDVTRPDLPRSEGDSVAAF